jgi:NAD(P)H dehydrogenase (quinone)
MNVLVVFDHPRRTSFCGAVLDYYVQGLEAAGHRVEIADLRAEGFDPRMGVEDEPDWADPHKQYSRTVLIEQARIERADALAFVFPIWWWSFPATTKGWIDRVWNNGWAYGERKLAHKKARMIAVAGSDAEHYAKRGYDDAIRTQLLTGIIDYCGIKDGALDFLYDALSTDETRKALLDKAYQHGLSF